MFNEYIIILYAFIISFLLAILLYLVSYLIVQRTIDLEKLSIYECGFEPFDDIRGVFEVRFYLVAISFVIFDLELIFLFPWILVLSNIGIFGYISMYIFSSLLVLVYIYEWKLGALEW